MLCIIAAVQRKYESLCRTWKQEQKGKLCWTEDRKQWRSTDNAEKGYFTNIPPNFSTYISWYRSLTIVQSLFRRQRWGTRCSYQLTTWRGILTIQTIFLYICFHGGHKVRTECCVHLLPLRACSAELNSYPSLTSDTMTKSRRTIEQQWNG